MLTQLDWTAQDAGGIRQGTQAARLVSTIVLLTMVVMVLLMAVGYLVYRSEVAHYSTQASRHPGADAIVILTGGADRMETALGLLEGGHAKRLLVSGVHPHTSRKAILKSLKRSNPDSRCCIDIDRNALDTRGNARETALWARKHGFVSLILVTSAYHLPRSLAEFGAAMPGVKLLPHAAVHAPAGTVNSPTLRTSLREYAKYIGSRLRIWLAY